MLLGIVPALIVGAVFLALFIVLLVDLGPLVALITPFASGWADGWRITLRVGLGIAIVVAVVVLLVFAFTTASLTVGQPFYRRIRSAAELEYGGTALAPADVPLPRAVGDSLTLAGRAGLTAALVAPVGLVPGVGAVAASVLGILVSARTLTLELTSGPLEARGPDRRARRGALAGNRALGLGFGIVAHLLLIVPFVAVFAMPTAVVGATLFVHRMRDTRLAENAPGVEGA